MIFRSVRCRTVFGELPDNFICGDCEEVRPRSTVTEDEERPGEDETREEVGEGGEAGDEIIAEDEAEAEAEEEDFPRVCPYAGCGRSFRRRKPFHSHLKLHQTRDTVEKLKEKKSRRRSKKVTKRKIGGGVFECEFCKKMFVYRKSFFKHVTSHQDPPPDHQCQDCGETFASSQELARHAEERHRRGKKREKRKPEYKEIKCQSCNIEFENLDLLSSHNIEVHGIVGDPCHICGKYIKRSSMRNHVMRVHHADQIRKYPCEICGKIYKTKTDLETHSTKHSGKIQRLRLFIRKLII